MNKKIRFILNPHAGRGLNNKIKSMAVDYFSPNSYDIEILFTTYPKQAIELSKSAVEKGYDIVVAIGGDGTVNEVAQPLKNSSTSLAIIPTGSGNGFSRHFKIPRDIGKAMNVIKNGKTALVDSLLINDKFCLNIAGTGFDAHIARLFANYGKRGFSAYAKLVFREYFSYKEKNYTIHYDGEVINVNAFLIAFANASQFGNSARIAPLAQTDDNLIDLVILKKVPLLNALFVIPRIFSGNMGSSSYTQIIKNSSFSVSCDDEMYLHLDGEPYEQCNKIIATVSPKSVQLIIP